MIMNSVLLLHWTGPRTCAVLETVSVSSRLKSLVFGNLQPSDHHVSGLAEPSTSDAQHAYVYVAVSRSAVASSRPELSNPHIVKG